MAARKDWSVWSLAPDRTFWMKVASELTMADATNDARRRNSFAAAITAPDSTTAYFLATPSKQAPGPEQVPPLVAEAETEFDRRAATAEGEPTAYTPDVPAPVVPVWYADHTQVVSFGRLLAAADILDTVDHTLDYMETPWSWDPEHVRWEQLGYPDPDKGGPEWSRFVDADA